MSKDFVLHIQDTERAQAFELALGTARVYVQSPIPQPANLPGHTAAPVYMLDLTLYTQEQIERLARVISEKWEQPIYEVKAEIAEKGVPILDKDVSLTIMRPHRWL